MGVPLIEVLRLYPPAPFMTRACKKRYRLPSPTGGADDGSGVWIEEGTPVVVPVYGIQRDPEYYPDPEVFDPKRFSEEEIKKRKSYTYYPAGEGPRVCVKAAIATVVSKYELHPSSKSPKPITLDPRYFVTVAKGGLWVHVEKID
ncbi:hypothetical protein J437_LFUL002228 [Ladona fulva]|uniref:Cytochrome P450 n=1 Tax=Ladona fulva TaxID=123851 RepID=A0A8K0JYE9_LADFU|nr:hypothetical protein J437_LFUL002228 [Ladona fulva]